MVIEDLGAVVVVFEEVYEFGHLLGGLVLLRELPENRTSLIPVRINFIFLVFIFFSMTFI